MAQTTVITLIDDIDGSEASETLTFGLDSTTYEIDLNDAHAEDLREVLAPFVSVARKGSGGGARRSSTSGSSSRSRSRSASTPDPREVRAWAEANGIEVSPRGRIKADVLEQYRAAAS